LLADNQLKKKESKCTDTQTSILEGIPSSAICVQNFDESRICNSHYVSHFAAFFIDARAKRSIAESCLGFCLNDSFLSVKRRMKNSSGIRKKKSKCN